MRGQGVALRSFLAMVIIFSAVVTLAAQRELGDKPWPYAEYALLAVGTVPAWGIRPYLRGLEDEG